MIKLTINSRLTNGFSVKKSKENECFWQMQEVPDQISIFKEWESVKTLIISLQPKKGDQTDQITDLIDPVTDLKQ